MDLIDLEDEQIDAEVLDSLAVSMENFRVRINDLIAMLPLRVDIFRGFLTKVQSPANSKSIFVQAQSFGKLTC